MNLRGRRNPLAHPEDRERLGDALRENGVESLIVDPFGRAYTGASQNDPGEVGAWLADLDRVARAEVGAVDVVLTAHAGWNGERSRGSSALEDWADSIVTLTRDAEDDSQRYLRATGRDVEVEEDQLHFDPDTRHLSLTGMGSRRQAAETRKVDDLVRDVVDAVTADPGLSVGGIGQALRDRGVGFRTHEESKAARRAVERGLLRVEKGPRRSLLHYPALSPSQPSPLPPGDGVTTPSRLSLYGEGVTGTTEPIHGRGGSHDLDLDSLGGKCHHCQRFVHATDCPQRVPAKSAVEVLADVLLFLQDRGEKTPCQTSVSYLWTSDDRHEREAAAHRCHPCLVLACRAEADEDRTRWHVWGGADRTDHGRRS